MAKKKRVAKNARAKTVRKSHDPLNTPLIRVVVAFVLGASVMLLVYKFFVA